jgi:outer membrane receptor protein involved in Fe transport
LPVFFARYGTGFKLPSFYALGNPLIGRPGLRPERSRDWEAGAEWTRAGHGLNLGLHVAYFDNRFRDLIDFDPSTFSLVNRDRVAITGVEGEGTLRVGPSVDMSGALTWLQIDSPTPLRSRPDWQGNLRLAWRPLRRIELNGAVRFNGDYADSSVPTGLVVTRGRAQADIGARWTGPSRVAVSAVLRNLADSRAETAVGFPELGRRLLATLTVGGR